MTLIQLKQLSDFVKDGKFKVMVDRAIASNDVEIRIIKEVNKDTLHYFMITVPLTKEKQDGI